MKKLLFIALLGLIGFTSNAQTSFNRTATNPTGNYTNTASDTVYYNLSSSYRIVTVQPIITKTSGTMAGTATLYYSVDGTNYVTTGSSLSLTDVTTNTAVWNITSAARYFRIVVSGGTTLAGNLAAKLSVTK